MRQPIVQIIRDSVPAVDPSAPRANRSWEWICSSLVSKESGECAVEILDTVFLQREQIWSWFYSSSGGVIRRKAQRKLTIANVCQQFSSHALSNEKNTVHYAALCWFEDQRRLQLMTAAECQAFLTSFKGTATLSAFSQPRGELDPTRYANIEYEYSVHKSGRLQGKLSRLALGNQRIMSMDNALNATVASMVQSVVSYVERIKKCRIVQCTFYLVMDDFGRISVWRTEDCQSIAVATSAPLPTENPVAAYDGPHAVNERVLARARADASKKPDEKLIQAILSSPTPTAKRPTLLVSASASQPTLPSSTTLESLRVEMHRVRGTGSDDSSVRLRSATDWDQAMQFLPASSSLSRGRKRMLSAAHLVSSQKKGCCGDYCQLYMHKWTTKRMTDKPLAPIAFGAGETPGKLSGARSTSVISATKAASAFLVAHPDHATDDFLQRKPMSPQRRQLEDSAASTSKLHTIPFKLIAQTRAEKKLVDLFIRRYQKGEDGDYLAEVYYGDGEPLGQTFPGYYYQEVQVCANCFTLYTLVEAVRMKAQNQVARRRSASRSSSPSRRNRAEVLRSGGLNALYEDRDDGEYATEQDDQDQDHRLHQASVTASRVWKSVWTHARSVILPTVSKKDAAELLSFTNPHPAVMMLINALGVVLLGRRELAPQEIKRLFTQDKLLSLVQRFELGDLQYALVEHAAAHVRNPLFSPEHIAPISSCAARFCDWFRTTMQAYAWKNVPLFTDDPETWKTLAFVNHSFVPTTFPDQEYVALFFSATSSKEAPALPPTVSSQVTSTTKKSVAAAARRAIQNQQMKRLAASTGYVEAATQSGTDAVFTCSDGVTQIPYTITGQAVGGSPKCNLIVFHDFFDTMDSTKVFFRPILAKHVGARALVFNLPGQAGTRYSTTLSDSDRASVLNNVWYAARVHELLEHLQETAEFITTGLPFHVVGFGNGANVATAFAVQYGAHEAYASDLQSLVLFNCFAKVDAQLAAILHSTVNVFSCLPPTRPDLPVTFFSKYLFSEGYLAKIDVNLALSIYTAVTNPISLDGRVRVCQGALLHADLTAQLPHLRVPLVLVQSVENKLVAPTSVDPFLQQRVNVAHSWSHQQNAGTDSLAGKTKRQLQQVLATPGSAFVSWLRAGHELRQEAKQYVSELLELVVCSKERSAHDTTPVETPPQPQPPRTFNVPSSPVVEKELGAPVLAKPPQSSTPASTTPLPAAKPSPSMTSDLRSVSKPQVVTAIPAADPPPFSTKQSTVNDAAPSAELDIPDEHKTPEPPAASPVEDHESILSSPPQATSFPSSRRQSKSSIAPTTDPIEPPQELPRPTLPEQPQSNLHRRPSGPVLAVDAPDPLLIDKEIDAVRARMEAEEKRLHQEAEGFRERQRRAAEERMEALRQEQDRRRRQWEEEDAARLAALERKLKDEQAARETETKKRELELLAADITVTTTTPIVLSIERERERAEPSAKQLVSPTRREMQQQLRAQPELSSVFDQMEAEEKTRKRVGVLHVDEFTQVRTEMDQNYRQQVKEHEGFLKKELLKRKNAHAVKIQSQIQRFLAMRRVAKRRQQEQEACIRRFAGGEIVRLVRGFLGRRRFIRYRQHRVHKSEQRASAIAIQRLFRGFSCRVQFIKLLRAKRALMIQRVYRGHRGRCFCQALKDEQARRRYQDRNAAKLQATWRMHVARDRFLTQRLSLLAATEIQRVYRGHRGRVEAKRKKAWHDAEPGPERLALGLQMIEGSKQTFERQQNEIDALHRAQEAVERQVSTIHAELQDSEKELALLERELQEIDQLEADLRELSHEAEMLHNGGLEGILRSTSAAATQQPQPLGSGVPTASPTKKLHGAPGYERGIEDAFESKSELKKRQADALAVEMAIQIKRVEREKKKKDLEAEFTTVFAEVQLKRDALAAMEEKLADMEATRMRKDREFARMQRNLMELLEEQKLELENLREKGIELEAATATSAAAAAATAMKAKEHEKRSQAMFESTEELMKFQFMSMSLSYFSSLNMLKNLRDINADTTSAAISSTAETAAAAAAAAAAANIPTMKRLQVGSADAMMAASQLKKHELERKLKEEEDAKHTSQQPLPDQVKDWTVDDVGRWLDSLSLPQYKTAFKEGAVDGEFLIELRTEDMADVLGVSHKLHVRKILVARNKLLPLSQQEQLQIDAVEHEAHARNARVGGGRGNGPTSTSSTSSPAAGVSLDPDTVFSQARNGRLKRLIESVDAGFDINAEDDKGNTLLLLACQNINVKMVEYLLAKRATINHKNAQGNTALHFAMAYDAEGKLGEFLIARGADDTIENSFGLTPYDGLQPE